MAQTKYNHAIKFGIRQKKFIMNERLIQQKQPIVPSSFSSFHQVHKLQRKREQAQQQSKMYPSNRIFIAPIHETRPLALDYYKIKKQEEKKNDCLPFFEKFDLPSIFSNKPITLSQFLAKNPTAQSQKIYQTPQRQKDFNEDNFSRTNQYEILNSTNATSKISKRFSLVKKSRPKEKGLRQLSHRAYQIVLNMKSASYKEVANKLVLQLNNEKKLDPQVANYQLQGKDELNIKRRVYDALNVLIALGVLRKDGRRIVGDRQKTLFSYERQLKNISQKISQKQLLISSKLRQRQQVQFKKLALNKLIQQNRQRKRPSHLIWLPFVILLNQSKEEIVVQKNTNGQIAKMMIKWKKSNNDLIKTDTQIISQFYRNSQKIKI